MITRATLGKSLGGPAPYGYKKVDKKLIPDETEAPIRKLMFDLFLQFKRRQTVARELNNRGYRTRKGAKFSDTPISRLLTDPIVMGKRRMNYTRSTGKDKAWEIKDKDEWIIVDVPPIISEQVYRQVSSIIEEQQAQNTKTSTKPIYLFTGYIHCHCGERMYVLKKLKKYVCKECKNKIPQDDMEAIFMEQLHEFVISDEQMNKVKKSAQVKINELRSRADKILGKKSEVYDEMSNLIDLHKIVALPTQSFGSRYTPLQNQFDQLSAELPRLEAEIVAKTIQIESTDSIIQETKTMYDRWSTLERAQKRAFIELTVDRITIFDDSIDIRISYMPYKKNLKPNIKTECGPSTHPCPCGYYNHPDKECVCGPGIINALP